jgi:epoxyqueuosine reductase QueG
MIAEILDKAQSLGASLVGAVRLDERIRERIELPDALDASRRFTSLLVLTLAHGENEPELDWWGGPGGTEGNRRLQEMSTVLKRALAQEHGIHSHILPYQPGKGGILLKNAAALAGLGVIGANNLLITPQLGPCVRLKAMLADTVLSADIGMSADQDRAFPAFDPCNGCLRPCWQACPQDAFASGAYDRSRCAIQMAQDEARAPVRVDRETGVAYVEYCRACELACPVGK